MKLLLERKKYEEAESWIAEGIEKTGIKLPGIAANLGTMMGESAHLRKMWEIAAAHAALEFFERPGREKFEEMMKAAAKAGCQESIRGFALGFLETGATPFFSKPHKGIRELEVRTDWPLPVPAYCVPLFRRAAESHVADCPHYDVLIDMAIADQRNDDVLRWYDAMRAGKKQPGAFSTWTGEHMAFRMPPVALDNVELWASHLATYLGRKRSCRMRSPLYSQPSPTSTLSTISFSQPAPANS